jgi:putative oxidoreductase
MDVVFLVGRILFVGIFLFAGSTIHLLNARQGIEYARMYKVPMAAFGVPFTGLLAVLGGLSVVLGLWGDLGALMIAAFLLLITPLMHAFWRETDAMQKQMQMTNFLKNFALLGGALVMFFAWNQLQADAGLSLTDPLFDRW